MMKSKITFIDGFNMLGSEELHVTFSSQGTEFDISLAQGESAHSVRINGVTYAVLGDEEKLQTACEILSSVSLDSISNSADLIERLSTREDLSFPTQQRTGDVGINTLNTQSIAASSSEPFYPTSDTIKSKWLREENIAAAKERKLIAEKYWEVNGSNENHHGLMNFLTSRLIGEDQIHLIREFEEALEQKDKEKFTSLFDHLPRAFVSDIEWRENLQVLPMRTFAANRKFTEEDTQNLKDYIRDIGFSGIVSLTSQEALLAVKTANIDNIDEPFATHSLGKAFTGILLMTLIQKGIITENLIKEPLQLEEDVLSRLYEIGIPKSVLENITLKQVMQHTSGLGDYLGEYQKAIQKSLDDGMPLPEIEKLEDLLQFADPTVKTLKEGEDSYSNLGSLLFGLSLQYHYNKYLSAEIKTSEANIEQLKRERDETKADSSESVLNGQIQAQEEHLKQLKAAYVPYSEILKQHVIMPAGLDSFAEKTPPNAHCDPNDPNTYVYGGPAGGYWLIAKDLNKFGESLYRQYQNEDPLQETSLHQLMEKYGSEFYHNGIVEHNGASSLGSAHFTVFLNHGVTVAILSDQSRLRGNVAADSLYYEGIDQNLLTEEKKE